MSKPTLLSIVIITHNQEKMLLDCLRTVFLDPISKQVIIVFNGCQDSSLSSVQKQFPECLCINNPENNGFSIANNIGLAKATGKYLMLLNDDTLIQNQALSKMIDWLEKNPKVGAVGPKLLNTDLSLQVAGSAWMRFIYQSQRPRKVSFLGFAACIFSRLAFEKVGFLDENYFFYNEELDYLKRIRKAGFETWYFPQAEIIHFGGSSTRKRRWDFELEGIKGSFYFVSKFYPWLNPLFRILFALLAVLAFPALQISAALKKDFDQAHFFKQVVSLAFSWSRKHYQARRRFDSIS